jgi:hypothetical protein
MLINKEIDNNIKSVTKALSTLNNLGIDGRLWHVFERASFDVNTLIKEIVRLSKIHTNIEETVLLHNLMSVFKNIRCRVVIKGVNESPSIKNIINSGLAAPYIIEFHTTRPMNITPLKLSAILSQGVFKNDFNLYITLFVKAITLNINDNQIMQLIPTSTFLDNPQEFLILKTGVNEIKFLMKKKTVPCGSIIIEQSFHWWSKLQIDVKNGDFFFTKKTREVMANFHIIRDLALKMIKAGFFDAKVRFNFLSSEWCYSNKRQIKLKCGRNLVWMGGKEGLTLHDLINKFHDLRAIMVNERIIDDFWDFVVIGNKLVRSCVSLSSRSIATRHIELPRLVREWIIYCVVREKMLSIDTSFTGISGIRTFSRDEILNDVIILLSKMNLPTNDIRIFEHFQNLESLGLLSYRGSGKGFTINDFQFSFDGIEISELSNTRLKNYII